MRDFKRFQLYIQQVLEVKQLKPHERMKYNGLACDSIMYIIVKFNRISACIVFHNNDLPLSRIAREVKKNYICHCKAYFNAQDNLTEYTYVYTRD